MPRAAPVTTATGFSGCELEEAVMDYLGNFDKTFGARLRAIAHRALERHAHRRAGIAWTGRSYPIRVLLNLGGVILARPEHRRIHHHDQHAEARQVLRNG